MLHMNKCFEIPKLIVGVLLDPYTMVHTPKLDKSELKKDSHTKTSIFCANCMKLCVD
jgi:hypothetical protein